MKVKFIGWLPTLVGREGVILTLDVAAEVNRPSSRASVAESSVPERGFSSRHRVRPLWLRGTC